jgi:hypothetical protein
VLVLLKVEPDDQVLLLHCPNIKLRAAREKAWDSYLFLGANYISLEDEVFNEK